MDIKASIDYVTDKTTYVVQAKRNTVAGLQALLNGKYIVTDEFVGAVVYGATPGDLEEPENLCPLERDFDSTWPDPLKYLPPPGKEQTAHPIEAFDANPERSTVFEGYTFVFGDHKQHENLLPAITNGHGKALICRAEYNKTTVDDFVKFMRNAAGERGFERSKSPSERGGIVLVRWITKPEMQDWANELADKVALRIGQRSIDQRDFLDAVVGNDASILRQALPTDDSRPDDGTSPTEGMSAELFIVIQILTFIIDFLHSIPRRESSLPRHQLPSNTAQEMSYPTSSKLRDRGISRIKAFDDGFDVDTVTSLHAAAEDDRTSQSADDQDEEGSKTEATKPVSPISETIEEQGKRKRSQVDGGEEDMVNELLPGAAAMKKRRLEANEPEIRKRSEQRQGLPPRKTKAKQKREVDVREAARKRREAEEEITKREKEFLSTTVNDDELREIKESLVEEIEIPFRTGRSTRAKGGNDDRWDDRWNGRKNFKGFRRKGDAQWGQNHTQKIMVPLVEVKQQSYGIGQEYWDDSDSDNARKKRRKDRPPRDHQQTQTQTQEEHSLPSTARLQQEAANVVGEVDVEQPRTTRLADKTQQSQQTMSQAQRTKRPGPGASSRASKRQKTIRLRDSDSDEEPKFQFGRRKRT